MSIDWNWVLILAGAVMVLVEVAFGGFAGFDLVLIGSSLLLGGGLGLTLHNAPLGLVVASALCVGYIALGRRWVRRALRPRSMPSNVDALVGQQGMAVTRIATHEPGQVRVRDEVWRAIPVSGAGPFEPGAIVTVHSVDGVTLEVR